jgi:hypothetical protein
VGFVAPRIWMEASFGHFRNTVRKNSGVFPKIWFPGPQGENDRPHPAFVPATRSSVQTPWWLVGWCRLVGLGWVGLGEGKGLGGLPTKTPLARAIGQGGMATSHANGPDFPPPWSGDNAADGIVR